MREGATDVIVASDPRERWSLALSDAIESQRAWLKLYLDRFDPMTSRIAGSSQVIMDLRRDLERLSPTDVNVLILGEAGVGKDLCGQILQESGLGGPMIRANCSGVPSEALDVALFRNGSDAGGLSGDSGLALLERGAGGVLLLHEIAEMDASLQAKLMRLMEARDAQRRNAEPGKSQSLRIVSCSTKDLEKEVKAGRFRADLYYRLSEFVLRVPPLRDHLEDLPELVRSFITDANERFGKNFETFEPELISRMNRYPWPGNVRELRNAVERMVLLHDGPILRRGWWDLPIGSEVQVARGRTAAW
jgi:two-component system nitrogen regulation response regulator NtrX